MIYSKYYKKSKLQQRSQIKSNNQRYVASMKKFYLQYSDYTEKAEKP